MRRRADTALIERALAGDADAFESLIYLHQDPVYGLCFRMLGNREDAEEVAASVFMNAFRALRSFRQEAAFGTWLYRIAANLSKNKLRALSRRPRAFSLDGVSGEDEPGPMELPSPAPQPDEQTETRELSDRVEAALLRLSPAEREILLLRDAQGLPYEEIGKALEVPAGTVKSRLSRARLALAGLLRSGEGAQDVERMGRSGV